MFANTDQSISISCELSGYLSEIQWRHNDTILTNSQYYAIYTSTGTKEAIGVDGIMRKSVVSQLTINNVNDATIGTYTCTVPDTELMENITVLISCMLT